jgi:hypothetical protein
MWTEYFRSVFVAALQNISWQQHLGLPDFSSGEERMCLMKIYWAIFLFSKLG